MTLGTRAEAYIGSINGVSCVFTRPGPGADIDFACYEDLGPTSRASL